MTARRSPGRPRDPAVDEAIEAASWLVLAEGGVRRLSPERVAERAGVAISTVYRRYRTADDILLRLMQRLFESLPVPDTGSLHGDLSTLVSDLSRVLAPIGPRRALIALWSAVEDNPSLGAVHDAAMAGRSDETRVIVERAVERGELSADADPTLVIESLTSLALLRVVNTRAVLSPADVEQAVALALHGVVHDAPSPARPGPRAVATAID